MLKTSSTKLSKSRKGKVGVGRDSKAGRDRRCKLDRIEISDDEVDDEVGKKAQKTFKSKKLSKSKKIVRSDFFISRAWLSFTKLRQAFVKAPIFYHFDLERHIWVEMDISGYAISGLFK